MQSCDHCKTLWLSFRSNWLLFMKNSWLSGGSLLLLPRRKDRIKPSSSPYKKSYARLTRWVPILYIESISVIHLEANIPLRYLILFAVAYCLAFLPMDSKRVDGKFLGPSGEVPASQAICSSLLEECFEISQEIKAQEESKHVATSLKPIYDRLSQLRAELENLVLTHRWSLRETDLWNYSLSLQEIDKMRVDGKFVDSEGNRPSGQYVSYSQFINNDGYKLKALCYG